MVKILQIDRQKDDAKDLFDNIVKYNITPTISDFYEAELLSEAAGKAATTAVFHIAVDTGMNRIGLKCDDASVEEIKKIKELLNIEIEVFSVTLLLQICLIRHIQKCRQKNLIISF